MRLIENWKEVLTKAWSVRLIAFGGMAELFLEYLGDGLPRWAILLLLVLILGARLVSQDLDKAKTEPEEPIGI
ncbi:MAG TPA: hypothetical protein VEZ16_00075 [Microvirga sp.]|nr:hypothetical protein [Microvirga sp.]